MANTPFVYEDIFGGTNVYPSDVSYGSIVLDQNVVYDWPLESAAGQNNLLPRILDVVCNTYQSSSFESLGTLTQSGNIGDYQFSFSQSSLVAPLVVGDLIVFDTSSTVPIFYFVKNVFPSPIPAVASQYTAILSSPLVTTVGSGSYVYRFSFVPWTITLPSANQTGTGQTVLINSQGSMAAFNVLSRPIDAPNVVLSQFPGTSWQIWLTDNNTEAGTWATLQYGAQLQSYTASNLAGYGLTVINNKLASATPVIPFNYSPKYLSGATDRAVVYVWTAGAGTFTLPLSASAGNNWFVSIRNQGTGLLTIAPSGTTETINGSPSLALSPQESITVVTDGMGSFYTLGYGRSAYSSFDYTTINLSGQSSPFVLSGNNLNRITYNFTGVLSSDITVRVPQTIQQYWVANNTTGAYMLKLATTNTADTGTIIPQGRRGIYYSDGFYIQIADNNTLQVPLPVASGGTGAITAASALVNLGGTSTGIAIFTANPNIAAVTTVTALGGATAVFDALGFTSVAKQFVLATSTNTALQAIGNPASINAYLGVATTSDTIALVVALG